MPHPTFTLDRDLRRRLIALTKLALPIEGSDRLPLTGLVLDHAGAWACDRYRIGFVPLETGIPDGERRLVQAVRFAKALREATRKTDQLTVDLDDDWAHVTVSRAAPKATDVEVERLVRVSLPYLDDGTYPDLHRLVAGARPDQPVDPEQDGLPLAAFDARFMAELADLSPAPSVVQVRKHDDKELGPNRVHDAAGRFLGVLMPVRLSVGGSL